MSEYDKELQSNTDEYEEAMKPMRRADEREEKEEEGTEEDRTGDSE